LVIAIVSIVAMTIYNLKLALVYFLLIGLCFLVFKMFGEKRSISDK